MKKELERIVRYERVVYELEERIKKLEAVAQAADEYTKVHGHNFGSGCACLLCEVEMALAALHGGE